MLYYKQVFKIKVHLKCTKKENPEMFRNGTQVLVTVHDSKRYTHHPHVFNKKAPVLVQRVYICNSSYYFFYCICGETNTVQIPDEE